MSGFAVEGAGSDQVLVPTNHATLNHAGVTGVPAAEAFTSGVHASTNHAGIAGVGAPSIGGTGIAGAVVYSSTQSVTGVVEATSITINGAVIISTSSLRAVHFRCSSGNFANAGTIDADGDGILGAVTAGTGPRYSNGHGSSYGGAGGDSSGSPAVAIERSARAPVFGGLGEAANSNGINTIAEAGRPGWVTDYIGFGIPVAPGTGGSAGRDSINSTNGDGGNGGGLVIIEANGNVTEGTITAIGLVGTDASSSGGDAGGGGGGGGGMLLTAYTGALTPGTVTLTPGAGGAGAGGAGTAGEAGETGLLRRIKFAA